MSKTLIIAELGSSWRFGNDHLATAQKMIREAKACGADVAKFQWASSGPEVAKRRGLDAEASRMYVKYLMYPADTLPKLKAMCDEAGIEFMVTCYLQQDIPVIAPLVKRFKVSAFESQDAQFIAAHMKPPWKHEQLIISLNPGKEVPMHLDAPECVKKLHCVSLYPTELDQLHLLHLGEMAAVLSKVAWRRKYQGLSDHSTSTQTGALAVAAMGAQDVILEKHVRLWDTPQDNPDYGHSLILDSDGEEMSFAEYVRNVREAERCM